MNSTFVRDCANSALDAKIAATPTRMMANFMSAPRNLRLRGASRDRVMHEVVGRRRAPLRAETDLDRMQAGLRPSVQHVRIGPVLVDAPPRVFPVVEDLAAEQMAPDAPDVPVLSGPAQMLVTHHEIV